MGTIADRQFLSVADVARRLVISKRTAYNLVEDHVVPVIEIRGIKRIPAGALERWLTEREEEALESVRRGDEAE
jgi:excisionase family DNA binding protein